VASWESRLSTLVEGLGLLQGIQRRWLYLGPIFGPCVHTSAACRNHEATWGPHTILPVCFLHNEQLSPLLAAVFIMPAGRGGLLGESFVNVG
jgi:hypothetical protein